MSEGQLTKPPVTGEYYVFRDPVHNLIEINNEDEGRLLRRILATREIQRLRHLKQNGLAAFVYPGIEGSRFQHSLGTYYVARRLIEHLSNNQPGPDDGFPPHLRITQDVVRSFPIAALLHDIGHGPLSHVWEEAFNFNHEEAGKDILSGKTEISTILSDDKLDDGSMLLEAVVGFLSGDHPLYYLVPLLSGNLDVDRLDFIARDSRSAGVTYGFHDFEWILRSLRFARLPASHSRNGQAHWIIAVDGRKGLTTLTQFLKARENMYELVYFHKTIRCLGAMLKLCFKRVISQIGISKGPKFPNRKIECWFNCAASNEALPTIIDLDDNDVWSCLKMWADEEKDEVLHYLSSAILSRKLFKYIPINKEQKSYLENIDLNKFFRKAIESDPNNKLSVEYTSYFPDEYGYDVVGQEIESTERQVWIIQDGRFGHEFVDLRTWWRKKHGPETMRIDRCGLIVERSLLKHILPLVRKLNGLPSGDAGNSDITIPGLKIMAQISDKGTQKKVYLALDENATLASGPIVALKQYRIGAEDGLSRDVDLPNQALGLQIGMHHNLSFARIIKQSGAGLVIAENFWDASLFDLYEAVGPTRNVSLLLDMGKQLFDGLAALHDAGIRHTDIKPENCGFVRYLTDAGEDKFRFILGDFGCCSSLPDTFPTTRALLGTERTRAPETLLDPPSISLLSDCWALGVTINSLMTGKYWYLPMDIESAAKLEGVPVPSFVEEKRSNASQDIQSTVASFQQEIEQSVPPALSNVLLKAICTRETRVKSSEVRDEFEAKRLEYRSPELAGKISNAWSMAEDIVTAINSGRISQASKREIQDWVNEVEELIPPAAFSIIESWVD